MKALGKEMRQKRLAWRGGVQRDVGAVVKLRGVVGGRGDVGKGRG